MTRREMTDEDWDQLDKMTDQDAMFDTLPILKEFNYNIPEDGLAEITLKFKYKKVRVNRLSEFCLERNGILVRSYQEIQAKETGKILEDAVHLILYRLNCINEQPPLDSLKYIPELNVPPHPYLFTRHPAKDSNKVDFEENKTTRNKPIAIECKNWAGYWIDKTKVNQITQRFKNYSDDYRKILLIPKSPYEKESLDQIKQNNIEVIEFSCQITYANDNYQYILNELLQLIAKDILNLDMDLPDLSCL